MKITVIASTYNAEEWLEKVLLGYRCQTWREFELIVADDGSRESTRVLVERYAADYPVPLRHIWHADDGYRRQQILNVAILAARHDYLLFTDGDCIPRHDFVQVHADQAEPGRFLSGGYCKLNMQASKAIRKPGQFGFQRRRPKISTRPSAVKAMATGCALPRCWA